MSPESPSRPSFFESLSEDSGSDGVESRPGRPRRRLLSRALLVLAVAALVLGAAYGAAYAYAGHGVSRGTSVDGVEIGGLTIAAAEQRLRDELVPQLDSPILAEVDGSTFTVVPSAAGMQVDVAATVAEAGGGNAAPGRLLRALWSVTTLEPRRKVDPAALRAALTPVAGALARQPRDGAVAFGADGEVQVTPAIGGRALDLPAAAAALQQAWRAGAEQVTLPVLRTSPKVTSGQVQRAVEELAAPAMSRPVRIVAGGRTASLSPAQLARILVLRPDHGRLALGVRPGSLPKVAKDAIEVLSEPASNAVVRIVDGRPVVVPSRPGRRISLVALAQALPAAATRDGDARQVSLSLLIQKPRISTKRAAALGVKQVVGQFTTKFPYADYRNVNIGRAAQLIDNTFLAPGQVFSLNDKVGRRTAANGFTTGLVINRGRMREELGGGVSQVATTTFNAMWLAGLQDVEHRPHALYIDRYPRGREATVWWPGLDLKFRNDTRYGVVVQASVVPSAPGHEGSVTVRLWSTKHRTVTSFTSGAHHFRSFRTVRDDRPGCVPQQGVRGFDVSYGRRIAEHGKPVKRESYSWSYQPEDRIFCTVRP